MESYMLVYYDTRPYGTVDHVAGPLGYSKGAFDLRIKWAERKDAPLLPALPLRGKEALWLDPALSRSVPTDLEY